MTSSPQRDELIRAELYPRLGGNWTQEQENETVAAISALIEQRELALLERVKDEVIGEDDSAYSDDGKRYFVHIFQQNSLRAEQRQRLALLNKEKNREQA